MRYKGGKFRGAKQIAEVVNAVRGDRPFWDPFCGGLSVSLALGGSGLISDRNAALICMYQSVADGWSPPDVVTRATHAAARHLPDTDPLKAFVGFGCSFGGDWFCGYVGDDPSHANGRATKRALLRDIPVLIDRGCTFECIDFLSEPTRDTGRIIYADPPYRNTSAYRHDFDSLAFDRRAIDWSAVTDVFVSEYEFPHGVELLRFNKCIRVNGAPKTNSRDEKLFYLERGMYS